MDSQTAGLRSSPTTSYSIMPHPKGGFGRAASTGWTKTPAQSATCGLSVRPMREGPILGCTGVESKGDTNVQ
ncbi:hypothetical protein JCM18920_2226 [Cutibacterium acnes JCM 18920]|nr:hypothetical protein JCM18920_2226 [Cutibacterium acnes JCM 18920]